MLKRIGSWHWHWPSHCAPTTVYALPNGNYLVLTRNHGAAWNDADNRVERFAVIQGYLVLADQLSYTAKGHPTWPESEVLQTIPTTYDNWFHWMEVCLDPLSHFGTQLTEVLL